MSGHSSGQRVEGRIDEDDAASMLQVALPTMLDFFGLLRLKAFMRNLHKATHKKTKRTRVRKLKK